MNEKTEFILSSDEIKCPKSGGILLIISGWGESGSVILQVSIGHLFGRCRKIFQARMAQPQPPDKNRVVIYAYASLLCDELTTLVMP